MTTAIRSLAALALVAMFLVLATIQGCAVRTDESAQPTPATIHGVCSLAHEPASLKCDAGHKTLFRCPGTAPAKDGCLDALDGDASVKCCPSPVPCPSDFDACQYLESSSLTCEGDVCQCTPAGSTVASSCNVRGTNAN